ncbi:flagellar hook assembly protein FlgD, partial [Mycobacterium tuberculosis]
CIETGSMIGCQDQSLGEYIPVAGTPYNLHYQSKRTEGYEGKSSLQIPLSLDEELPDSLRSITVTIHIAGRTIKRNFAPSPGQSYTFHWDGKDAYNRLLIGSHPYTVAVDYNWELRYYPSPSDFQASFARLRAMGQFIGRRAEREIATRKEWEGALSSPVNPYKEAGIGGWSLDNWHVYEPASGTLVAGNGISRTLPDHIGGASQLTYRRGPDLAEEAILTHHYRVYDLEADSDGGLILSASSPGNFTYLYRLDRNGKLERLQYSSAPTKQMTDFHVDSDGGVYMLSSSLRAINRLQLGSSLWQRIAGRDWWNGDPTLDFDGQRALD